MKRKFTLGLTSATAAMSAVVCSTVLPSSIALAQPKTAPATAAAKATPKATPKATSKTSVRTTPKASPRTVSAATASTATASTATASATAAAKENATATASALSAEDMVKQANDEVFKSMAERNAALYDQRVADDAVLLGFGPGIVAKFKAFPNDPKDPKVEAHRVNNMRVRVEGNTAFVVGRFWVRLAGANKSTQETADFLNVFTKRDNRWQLIASHLNMSNP